MSTVARVTESQKMCCPWREMKTEFQKGIPGIAGGFCMALKGAIKFGNEEREDHWFLVKVLYGKGWLISTFNIGKAKSKDPSESTVCPVILLPVSVWYRHMLIACELIAWIMKKWRCISVVQVEIYFRIPHCMHPG